MAIEIVDFPMNSMVDLSIVRLVYQRVSTFMCIYIYMILAVKTMGVGQSLLTKCPNV